MLVNVDDIRGVVPESYVGLSGEDYDKFVAAAIERAYLTLRQQVPKATFDDARANFNSGSPTEPDQELRWAEYWLARYEIETDLASQDINVSERAGSMAMRRDPEQRRAAMRQYLAKANSHLRRAGFDSLGGGGIAGVRGGDPLSDPKPWFLG